MEIKEIADKKEWEDFLATCNEKTFLHSWNWGEFQNEMREKIWRFGVFENGNMIAAVLVVKVAAKRGTFLLVPHGPVSQIPRPDILEPLLLKLKDIAHKENAGFIRINPVWKREEETIAIFKKLGFKNSPLQMHPEASWKLNITFSQEELFSNMRKTTRYLINQTQRNKDIEIRKSTDIEDVKVFSKMHELVSHRQRFVPFSIEYLLKEFSAFSKDNQILLLFGIHKGEIAAASFVIFWSGIGFYHHAASLPKFAKYSIPYLLLWEAIREAKERGCQLYDFWGYVNPKDHPSHPWAGPTLFKMGFGGNATEYVVTQDYPLKSSYWITWLFERVRKFRRHL